MTMTAEDLRKMSEQEVMTFIRKKLSFKEQFPEIFEHVSVYTDEDTVQTLKEKLEKLEKNEKLNEPDQYGRIEYQRYYPGLDEEHLRFDMTGYDKGSGKCTIQNMGILNKFADLGIYDYTYFLFLDFHKGSGTIYMKYWDNDEYFEDEQLGGLTTTEIIYYIFKLTIFSGRKMRRRF